MNNNINKDVRELVHPSIVKQANIVTIIIALTLILAGLVSVIIWTPSAGIITIIAGAVVYIYKPKVEVYTPTGSHVYRKSYIISSERRGSVEELLKGELNDTVEPLQFFESGPTRLDIIYTKEYDFIAWQIFHFIPHKYSPITQVYELTGPPALHFMRYINRGLK